MFTLETLRTQLAENDKINNQEDLALKRDAKKVVHVLYDFEQEYIKEIKGILPKDSELLMYRAFFIDGTLVIPHNLDIMGHPKVLKIYKKNARLDFNLKIAAYAIKYAVAVLDSERLLTLLAYYLNQLYLLVPKYQVNHPDSFLHWRFRSEAQILSQDQCIDQTRYQKDNYWVIFNSKLMEEFTSNSNPDSNPDKKEFGVKQNTPDEFSYPRLNQNLFTDYAALKDENNHAEWAFDLIESICESELHLTSPDIAAYIRNISLTLCLIPRTIERAAAKVPREYLDFDKEVVSSMVRSLFIMEYNAYINKSDPPVLTLTEANRILSLKHLDVDPFHFTHYAHDHVIRVKGDKKFFEAGGVDNTIFKKNLSLLTGNLFENIKLSDYNAYLSGSTFFACAYNHINPGVYRRIETFLIDRYNDVDLDIMVDSAENLAKLVAKIQSVYPGRINLRGKNAQHVEYYAELPNKTVKIDMFIYERSPAFMVSRFHLGCVRGYWDGEEIYVLPSFIITQKQYWSPDIRSTFNQKLAEILDKYYDRGVGFFLNNLELNELHKYKQLPNYSQIFTDEVPKDRSYQSWSRMRKDKIITFKSLHKKLKSIY